MKTGKFDGIVSYKMLFTILLLTFTVNSMGQFRGGEDFSSNRSVNWGRGQITDSQVSSPKPFNDNDINERDVPKKTRKDEDREHKDQMLATLKFALVIFLIVYIAVAFLVYNTVFKASLYLGFSILGLNVLWFVYRLITVYFLETIPALIFLITGSIIGWLRYRLKVPEN